MQLIKDQQIIDDNWINIDDDAPLLSGNIIVSLQRWQKDKRKLLDHPGNLGIRLKPDDSLEEIVDDLNQIKLIEIYFPVFTDGRCFSQIRLLRQRYHFGGEIRVNGHYLRDQIFYLHRVGANAFKLSDDSDLQGALSALKEFSVCYQA